MTAQHVIHTRQIPQSVNPNAKEVNPGLKIASIPIKQLQKNWDEIKKQIQVSWMPVALLRDKWYFAASRRYHRFSSHSPRFVAGGRAFTRFLLIGGYLQNPWGNFWNTYPHDCNIWLMRLWFVRRFQNNSWTQGFWTISTSSNWKQHVPTWITS